MGAGEGGVTAAVGDGDCGAAFTAFGITGAPTATMITNKTVLITIATLGFLL